MATLLIWNNHYYPMNSYPGHAAMSIDGLWGRGNQKETYVSWWPKGGEKGPKETVDNVLSVSMDLELEGYAPDHIIDVPGLNVGAMKAKWKQIVNDPNRSYRFLRQNCSTIVSLVLKEGSTLGSTMERNNLIWTPLKVMRLAHAMGGQEILWTDFLGRLRDHGYLNNADIYILKHLYKRDSKHGKVATGNQCYYSNGRKVNTKMFLQWSEGMVGVRGAKTGMPFLRCGDGSLLTQGQLNVNLETKKIHFQTPQPHRANVTIGRGRQ